jgi:hypothetical protein
MKKNEICGFFFENEINKNEKKIMRRERLDAVESTL